MTTPSSGQHGRQMNFSQGKGTFWGVLREGREGQTPQKAQKSQIRNSGETGDRLPCCLPPPPNFTVCKNENTLNFLKKKKDVCQEVLKHHNFQSHPQLLQFFRSYEKDFL